MGWSFRESIKILPGIRLNFSRRGVGASIGPKGLHLGFGGRPPRITGGIGPLHYYQSLGSGRGDHQRVVPARRRRPHFHLLALALVGVVGWFGWHALPPESKSALLKPLAPMFSQPGEPVAPADQATTILPEATPTHPSASAAPEERHVPRTDAHRRKESPRAEFSR